MVLGGQTSSKNLKKNKTMIANAVELNPRQVKRFINNVILAKAVLDKPIDELVAVQALNFRPEWNNFLELITPNMERKIFLREYRRREYRRGLNITNKEQLVQYNNEISEILLIREQQQRRF